MIKVSHLSKSYVGKAIYKALDDVNFTVNPGEIFGIIGRSGAGKSTLIKCLNLLERPDSGKIIFDGIELQQLNKHDLAVTRSHIGMIFQNFNLLNSKTVFANVALPLIFRGGLSRELIHQKVMDILELVELTEFAHKYPASLSGGQKQRVGIARALVAEPKLLLSDEATSALDPQTTASILDLLLSINQRLGITIILITHEIEVVRKICDKVAVIDSGEIIEQGNAFDILLHPKHPLTRKLIIEEETDQYLAQVKKFYQFIPQVGKNIVILSFVGEKTYQPLLNIISHEAQVEFSILRGELGRIKNMPFGQLLVEINGTESGLQRSFEVIQRLGVHYEIVR